VRSRMPAYGSGAVRDRMPADRGSGFADLGCLFVTVGNREPLGLPHRSLQMASATFLMNQCEGDQRLLIK
jgi:hypothetical protein